MNWVGRQTPLHATSSGKVLLANAAPVERTRLVEAIGLAAYTAETITDAGQLEQQLQEILDQGYATTEGEYEDGLNAVAVPVRDARGMVVAALSASGPSYRLTADRMEEQASLMKDAGERMSQRLGYVGS
jgi:DNA-binding IclR family transcriptional regulator